MAPRGAMLFRLRTSRLFIVLLHLCGSYTNLDSAFGSGDYSALPYEVGKGGLWEDYTPERGEFLCLGEEVAEGKYWLQEESSGNCLAAGLSENRGDVLAPCDRSSVLVVRKSGFNSTRFQLLPTPEGGQKGDHKCLNFPRTGRGAPFLTPCAYAHSWDFCSGHLWHRVGSCVRRGEKGRREEGDGNVEEEEDYEDACLTFLPIPYEEEKRGSLWSDRRRRQRQRRREEEEFDGVTIANSRRRRWTEVGSSAALLTSKVISQAVPLLHGLHPSALPNGMVRESLISAAGGGGIGGGIGGSSGNGVGGGGGGGGGGGNIAATTATSPTLLAPSSEDLHVRVDIPVNPYVSPDRGDYEDPTTSLLYSTDLAPSFPDKMGRHSLVGVGLYTRTVFKIKVYGVALYVNEDQVRSDTSMSKFAHMSATELASSSAFYNCLASMGCVDSKSSSPLPSEGFDRSLLLQLNMQLDAETMRSSLQADWGYLTQTQKDKLTDSSFTPRPAGKATIAMLASGSTTCTCGQVVPAEFSRVNSKCCARGTALMFTWTREGSLEIRLNGVLMETFHDPNMGKAIFYEYMREDDPISPDARSHFADGFPAILAPLNQFEAGQINLSSLKSSSTSPPLPPSSDPKFPNFHPHLLLSSLTWHASHHLSHITHHINSHVAGLKSALDGARKRLSPPGGRRAAASAGGEVNAGGPSKPEGSPEVDIEEDNDASWGGTLVVHVYLLLLLMVSLPSSRKGEKILIIRRRLRHGGRRIELRGIRPLPPSSSSSSSSSYARLLPSPSSSRPSLHTIDENSYYDERSRDPESRREPKGMKKSLSWCF